MKPKSFNKVDGGRATARVIHVDKGTHTVRDEKAYWEVLAAAKKQIDADEWAVDKMAAAHPAIEFAGVILSALGLDGKDDMPPSPVPLVWPDGGKGPGARPKTATQFPEPVAEPEPEPEPVKPATDDRAAYWARRRNAAKKARAEYLRNLVVEALDSAARGEES